MERGREIFEETEHNTSNRYVLRLREIKDSTRNLTTSITVFIND